MLNKEKYLSLIVLLAMLALLHPAPLRAAEAHVITGGSEYDAPIRSWVDVRFKNMVRQRLDYSCGSAALATLLNYHYGYPVDEMVVLKSMFDIGDQEKIRKEGFSLLDMKNYLASVGFRAEGYRDSLDKLRRVGIPAIALINDKGYLHFVVIKAVSEREVLVGDPSHGVRVLDRRHFEKTWNSILFVIQDRMAQARPSFNTDPRWVHRASVEINNPLKLFGEPLSLRSLGGYTVDISLTPNYY